MKNMLETIKQQFLADKKKSAALSTLLCVLIVVMVRAFVSGGGSVPETAVALQPVASAPPVNQAIRPVLEKIAPPAQALPPPPVAKAEVPQRRTVVTSGLQRTLHRDFFMTDEWTKYPLEASQIERVKTSSGPDFWSSVAGAMRQYGRQRREEAETLSKELSELQLQSTLTGTEPLAYISGHLVRPGEVFSGFSVLRIEERRVVLEKYGQIHALVMH